MKERAAVALQNEPDDDPDDPLGTWTGDHALVTVTDDRGHARVKLGAVSSLVLNTAWESTPADGNQAIRAYGDLQGVHDVRVLVVDEKNLTDPDDDLVVDARAKGIGWPLEFACEERAIEAAVLGGTLDVLDVRGENIPWLDDSTLGSLEAKLEGLTGGVRVDFEAPNHFTTRFHVTPTTPGARMDELFAIGQLAENPNVTQDGICVPPGPDNDLSFVVTVPVTNVANVTFSTLELPPGVPKGPARFHYKDRCDEWTMAARLEGLNDVRVDRRPGSDEVDVRVNVTRSQEARVQLYTRDDETNEEEQLSLHVKDLPPMDPAYPYGFRFQGSMDEVDAAWRNQMWFTNSRTVDTLTFNNGCIWFDITGLDPRVGDELNKWAIRGNAIGQGGAHCAMNVAEQFGRAYRMLLHRTDASRIELEVGEAGTPKALDVELDQPQAMFALQYDLDGSTATRANHRLHYLDGAFRNLELSARSDNGNRGFDLDFSPLLKFAGLSSYSVLLQPEWTKAAGSPPDVFMNGAPSWPSKLYEPKCWQIIVGWDEDDKPIYETECWDREDMLRERIFPAFDAVFKTIENSVYPLAGRAWGPLV